MTAKRKSTVLKIALGGLVCAVTAAVAVQSTSAQADTAIGWGECPGGGGSQGMECKRVKVPVDWDEPRGRKISLLVGRLPATGEPKGTVTVNYGGPGGPAVGAMRDQPEVYDDLREHMNVVTWDYRGYTSLDGGPLCKQKQAPIPDLPTDQEEFDALAAQNLAVATECRDNDPALFDNMDAASNARDLEAVRKTLHAKELNLISASYGGIFAQSYARRFPHRVRTIVLDGTWDHGLPAKEQAENQARDNEKILRRFFDWCAEDSACVLNGTDVPRRWRALVEAADQSPVPAPEVDVEYTGLQLRQLAIMAAAAKKWEPLAAAIRDAEAGDASGFAFNPGNPLPTTPSPGATECLDFARPSDQDELVSMVDNLNDVAPNAGAAVSQLSAALTCTGWPTPVTNPPSPLPTEELPPLLGGGTWLEYDSTNRAVSRIPGSTAIRYDGPGHSPYLGMRDACFIGHANTYLVDRTLPEPGTTCPAGS